LAFAFLDCFAVHDCSCASLAAILGHFEAGNLKETMGKLDFLKFSNQEPFCSILRCRIAFFLAVAAVAGVAGVASWVASLDWAVCA
jgi:hypothetical protein